MIDFQQKRKLRSFMYHKTTLVILCILVIIGIRSTWSVYSKQRESEEMRKAVEKKAQELITREENLKQKIENIKTEHGIEEEIRSKFSVAKNDENIVIILDNNTPIASATTSKTFWQKIKEFLWSK